MGPRCATKPSRYLKKTPPPIRAQFYQTVLDSVLLFTAKKTRRGPPEIPPKPTQKASNKLTHVMASSFKEPRIKEPGRAGGVL